MTFPPPNPQIRQPNSAPPNGTFSGSGHNSTHGSQQPELSQLLSVFQQQIGQSIRDSLKNEMASMRDSLNNEMASMRDSLTNEMAILRNTVNNSSSHPVDGTCYFHKKDVAEKNQELHHNLLKIGQQKFKEWCSGYGFNIKMCKQSKDAYRESIEEILDTKERDEMQQIASKLKVTPKVVLDYVVGYISKKANNTKPCYCCVEVVRGHVNPSTLCPSGMESKRYWKLPDKENTAESATPYNAPNSQILMATPFASQYRMPLSDVSNATGISVRIPDTSVATPISSQYGAPSSDKPNGPVRNMYSAVSRPSSTSSYGHYSDSPVLEVRGAATENFSQSRGDIVHQRQATQYQTQHGSQTIDAFNYGIPPTSLSENSQSAQPDDFSGSQDRSSSQSDILQQDPSPHFPSVTTLGATDRNLPTAQAISDSQYSIPSDSPNSANNVPTLHSSRQPPFGSTASQLPNGIIPGGRTQCNSDPNPVIDSTQINYTTLSSSITIKVSDDFKPTLYKLTNSLCHSDLPFGRVREKFCHVQTPFAASDPAHHCIKCGRRIHQICGVQVQYSDISQEEDHVMCFLCYESETANQRISAGINSRQKEEANVPSTVSKKSKQTHLDRFLLTSRPWTKDTLEEAYIEDASIRRTNAFLVQVTEGHLLMAEFGAKLWIEPILNLKMFEDNLKKYSNKLGDMGKLMATIKCGLSNFKTDDHLNAFVRSNALKRGHTAYLYVMVRFNLCDLDMGDFSMGLWKACVQILALYLGQCDGEIVEKMEQWMQELATVDGSQYFNIEFVRSRPTDKASEFLKKLFGMPKPKKQTMENMVWRLFRRAVEALCSMTEFSDPISTTEWDYDLMKKLFNKVPTQAKITVSTTPSLTINLILFASTFLNYTPPQDQKLRAIHHSAFFILSRTLKIYNKSMPREFQTHHMQLQRIAMTTDPSVKSLLQEIGF